MWFRDGQGMGSHPECFDPMAVRLGSLWVLDKLQTETVKRAEADGDGVEMQTRGQFRRRHAPGAAWR